MIYTIGKVVIKLGATIKGVYRSESFELPVEAIREMIVNAHCHRNFNDDSCVQVALYDNRLEVTSPGGLYNGLTFENAMNGHSRLRNRSIANVFCQIGLIESWGTGLRRIKSLAAEFELPVPEFIETNNFFRVNLFRRILNADVLRDVSVKQTKRADVNFDLSPQVYRNSEDFPQDHRNIEISPQAHSKLLELLNLLPCK